jgi:hypothetical protein
MFANISSLSAFTATLLSLAIGTSSVASANHHDHIDRVAVRVQKNAQRLLEETRHYRNAPGYHQLVAQTRLVRDTAIHIHDVTHFEGNVPQLRRDVAMIDRSFHQLEDLFCHIEAEIERGRCHLNVNTNRFRRKMKQLEREIHHLGDDLAKICAAPRHSAQRQTVRYAPPIAVDARSFANPYSRVQGGFQSGLYGQSHRSHHSSRYHDYRGANYDHSYHNNFDRTALGFSIGGGSSRIWIGF